MLSLLIGVCCEVAQQRLFYLWRCVAVGAFLYADGVVASFWLGESGAWREECLLGEWWVGGVGLVGRWGVATHRKLFCLDIFGVCIFF